MYDYLPKPDRPCEYSDLERLYCTKSDDLRFEPEYVYINLTVSTCYIGPYPEFRHEIFLGWPRGNVLFPHMPIFRYDSDPVLGTAYITLDAERDISAWVDSACDTDGDL